MVDIVLGFAEEAIAYGNFPPPGPGSPLFTNFMKPGVPNYYGFAIDITGETCHEEDSIPYMLYNIQGKNHKGEEFSLMKGYAEFVNLRKIFQAKWPQRKIPSLPDATLFSDWEEQSLKEVMNGLTAFLLLVSMIPALFDSPDFHEFLVSEPLPGKQQVEILTKLNPFIKYINPATHVQGASIDITKEFEVPDFLIFKRKEYIIRGHDEKGEFAVSRNHKDFVLIKEILAAKFPEIPFSHLPDADTPNTVSGLTKFLKRINKMPEVYHSEEYQIFIRHAEPGLQEKLKPFKKSKGLLSTLF